MPNTARRHKPGTAAYANGQATAELILERARDITVSEGLDKLSMRGIARSLGLSPGNLSYYYKTKADLIADLFAFVLEPYLEEFERLRQQDAGNPEDQLRHVLEFVFDDLQQSLTTHFFPQMWALSLRDATVSEHMERIYTTYRSVLEGIIRQLRPDAHPRLISDLALTISAGIEGHTMFTGHARPHQARAAHVKPLVIEHYIRMVYEAGQSSDPSNKSTVPTRRA